MIKRVGPELAVAAVMLMWASTYPITKETFKELQPLAFTGLRFAIIVVFGWAVAVLAGKNNLRHALRLDRADAPRMAATGLLGYFLYQIGFTVGLDNTSPFSASLMVAMFPLVSLLIVAAMGEKQQRLVWIGSGISLVGVAIFLLNGDTESRLLGNLIAFAGTCAFAGYQVIGRPLVRKYSAETFAAWTTTFGGIPLVIVGMPQLRSQNWAEVSATSWLVVVYMAIFPAYIAYMLWSWAIRERSVAITLWSLLTPILAGIIAAIMVGEVFGPVKVLGAAIALGGLVFMRLPSVLKRAPQDALPAKQD